MVNPELRINLEQRRDLLAQLAFQDFDESKINVKTRFSIPNWFGDNAWLCYQVICYSSILCDENTCNKASETGRVLLNNYLQYKNEIDFSKVCRDIGIALLTKQTKIKEECLSLINQAELKEINTPSRLFNAFLAAHYLKDSKRMSVLDTYSEKLFKKAPFKTSVKFKGIFDAINHRNKTKVVAELNEILAYHHKTVSHHRARDYNQAESFICLYALGAIWLCSIRDIDVDVRELKSHYKLLLPATKLNEVRSNKCPKYEIEVDYVYLARYWKQEIN